MSDGVYLPASQEGPFSLRQSGANNFVSKIDPDCNSCIPPGKADFVEGWDNPDILEFDTIDEAKTAASQVVEIEGIYISIESLA